MQLGGGWPPCAPPAEVQMPNAPRYGKHGSIWISPPVPDLTGTQRKSLPREHGGGPKEGTVGLTETDCKLEWR